MQDILDKKADVERTLQEVKKYAALNGGNTVPDRALEGEIGRLETHLKQMDLRLESLPPCQKAPDPPDPSAAIAAIKGCIIIPQGLPEAKKRQAELEQEIRTTKKRIDYVTQVKGIADYLKLMKMFSAGLGIAMEMIPSGVSHEVGGKVFDFIKVMISAADSKYEFTQPGQVKNWKGRAEYHGYLNENKDEINKAMSKRAREKGLVDPKTGNVKISPYEASLMGNDFVSQVAKRELEVKWKRWHEAIKEYDVAKKKAEELEKELKLREKRNLYFQALLRRLEGALADSKWIQNPRQFEKMKSEIKVTIVDHKTGQLLQAATATVAPSAGTARTAANPYEFEAVSLGSYNVTSSAPGYVKETSAVNITKCQPYTIVVRLKKKPVIKVADIKDEEGHLLDDVNVDVTALTAGGSSPGSQNYRRVPISFIVDPGAFTVTGTDTGDVYETTSANVNAEAGAETEVHLLMRKKGAALIVEVWDSLSNLKIDPPPGANEPSVQLEPLDKQAPPSRAPYKGNGEVPFSHIAAGRYKYTARFCGWETQTGEFTVSGDDVKTKRVVRRINLKPTHLDSFTGNVFEHGASEHIDGFKVSLTGLGPRKGYRYDTVEGKDPDPNVAGLHSGAFVIKGPLYSGRYKLQITRKCFQPLIVDDWWVFCGIEPNANSTFSPQNFQLHPTAEFDQARQQVRGLMTKMTEERKKAAAAADQIADARRKMQDLPELAQALVKELEAVKQLHPTLTQECADAEKLVSEINDACKLVAGAASKIASLGNAAKTSAGTACELSEQAQKATDPTTASDLGNQSKELAAQTKKTAEEAKKVAEDAHKSYETAAQKQNKLKQLEQKVSDLQKAFSASSGKLEDLRKRLEAAQQATKSLAQADAAATEAARMLATIRQLLQGCADNHPGKPLLENAEQASNGVVGERKRATDEEGLLKGFLSSAEGVAKQADGLGKEIESVLKSCARVQGSGALVSEAKANLEKIDAFSLAAQNFIKVADDCAAKAIASADVTVPNLAVFDNVSEMKVALEHVDLKGAFLAKGKPPSKEKEFKFAGQSPAAGTKVKRGSTVSVSVYQKFEEITEATPGPAASDEVLVPSMAAFDNVSEMKVALTHNGLVGAFSAKGTPPSKEKEFKFAGQSPAAGTKVKRGSTVSVSVYQKFEEITEATPGPAASDEVLVPSMAAFDNVSEMKVALAHNGLVGAFSAKGNPPSKEKEFKFAGQSPAAGTKVKRGSTVAVSVYQKFDETAATASPTPESKPGTMPNLIGLTIDQASSRLIDKMSIGGDEVGDKPPTPEKAYTIFAQNPAPNAKIPTDKTVVVTVKRYGSAKTESAPALPPSAGEDPFAFIEKKYKHYYLKGGVDEAKKNGLKHIGDWQFSIRKRADGNLDYFFHSQLLRVDKAEGDKVYLTDPSIKDKEVAPMVVEINDEFVRVTRIVEYSDPSRTRILPDGSRSYFYKTKETATLPFAPDMQAGLMIEAANPESPEELKKLQQMFGEPK